MGATMNALVDVAIATFNHRPFIAQALDSVLAQKTAFPVRIIVGDDCSADGTAEVVRDYARRYPDQIKAILHPVHIGLDVKETNGMIILKQCTAKYIALLDGDDYWTDPQKLQLQVDFLEARPDYSECFHPMEIVYENGPSGTRCPRPPVIKDAYTAEDLFEHCNFIPTASMLCRRDALLPLPEWWAEARLGDWVAGLWNAQKGPIGFIDRTMCAYRVHRGGMYAGQARVKNVEERIRLYQFLNRKFDYRYNWIVRRALAWQYFELAREYAKMSNRRKAFSSAMRGIMACPWRWEYTRHNAAVALSSVTPRLYAGAKSCMKIVAGKRRPPE